MSGRELDVDGLFERDADSRLLERRRREELGLGPQAATRSATPVRMGAESIVEDEVAAVRGPVLRVELDARPAGGLIPGALVTVAVAVHDDGDAAAGAVRLRLALPPELEPAAGSFVRDGAALDGTALVSEGLQLGAVGPGEAIRLHFTARVLPGTEPLDLSADASAPGVPVVGAPTLRLERRGGHVAYEAPRAFFELEPGEHDEDLEAVAAAPEHAVDALLDEPALPLLAPPEPQAPPEPEAPSEPDALPEPEALPVSEPVPQPPGPSLVRSFGPDDARALERIFAGGVPHGLAAFALLTATACTQGPLADALGVEPFRAAVAAALPRALVAARMRKPTPPLVTREMLGLLRADGEALGAPCAPPGPALALRLEPRDLEALRGVLRRDLDDPFLRGVQVLLALAPRALEGGGGAHAGRLGELLAGYRVSASAWLMRVTVRHAVDKRYDPLTAEDAALHEAGTALAAALREACA